VYEAKEKGGGEQTSVIQSVGKSRRRECVIVHFIGIMVRGSTIDKMSAAEKKNSRVSPRFYI
jgi:hypothetical protein